MKPISDFPRLQTTAVCLISWDGRASLDIDERVTILNQRLEAPELWGAAGFDSGGRTRTLTGRSVDPSSVRPLAHIGALRFAWGKVLKDLYSALEEEHNLQNDNWSEPLGHRSACSLDLEGPLPVGPRLFWVIIILVAVGALRSLAVGPNGGGRRDTSSVLGQTRGLEGPEGPEGPEVDACLMALRLILTYSGQGSLDLDA